MSLSMNHDDPRIAMHDDVAQRKHHASGLRARSTGALIGMLICIGMSAFWAPAVQAQQDLALMELVEPVSACALTGAEDVSIRMFNHGPTLVTGTTIQFMYVITGNSSVNDSIVLSSDFSSKTSMNFTFAAPANLAAPGDYHFMVSLNLAGDINTGNNTIHDTLVQNTAPSLAGTIAAPGSGGSGVLTVTGNIGAVVQWEESLDEQRWVKLANDSTSQGYAGVTVPTRFRVRVANAPCAAAASDAVTVTP
jgi:hypothetical protein